MDVTIMKQILFIWMIVVYYLVYKGNMKKTTYT
jgi:hypothetical protein